MNCSGCPPDLSGASSLRRVVLSLWIPLFLAVSYLEGAGALGSLAGPDVDVACGPPHSEAPDHRSGSHGSHDHGDPACLCSSLCEVSHGRALAVVPIPPDWCLHVVPPIGPTGSPVEFLSTPQPFLIPYSNGPPLRAA